MEPHGRWQHMPMQAPSQNGSQRPPETKHRMPWLQWSTDCLPATVLPPLLLDAAAELLLLLLMMIGCAGAACAAGALTMMICGCIIIGCGG